MTDIVQLQDLFYGRLETVDDPNPRLAQKITATDLTINLTAPVKDEDGTVMTTKDFTMIIVDAQTKKPEEIYVQAGELDATGKIITLAGLTQRGIDGSGINGIDFFSGTAARRISAIAGSDVRINISALHFQMMVGVMFGTLRSGGKNWLLGRNIDEDITVFIENGDTNRPFWRYVAASNGFFFSNDGVSSTPFGTGAGVTGGDGITVTSGDIDIDLTDTVIFVQTSSGAGDSGKAGRLNASGKFADGFQNITLANATTVTDGSNADALHKHTDKLGTLNAGATINGATLPVPVYQDAADNEVKACDGNVVATTRFIGFAVSNSTDGNPIDVQFNGVVAGFTGLTEGVNYFVQDAVGTIGTAKGTLEILVGEAISETQILIKRVEPNVVLSALIDTGTLTSTGNTDTTIDVGFLPSLIEVKYVLQGLDNSNIEYSQGTLFVNGAGTLISVQHIRRSNQQTAIGDPRMDAATPIAGGVIGNATEINVSVNSVSSTQVVIRFTVVSNSGGQPSDGQAQVIIHR